MLRGRRARRRPPIPIEVVPGSIRPREPQRSDPSDRGTRSRRSSATAALAGPAAEPKLLVEAWRAAHAAPVGEPLLLTYFLDTQASVTDLRPRTPRSTRASGPRTSSGPDGPRASASRSTGRATAGSRLPEAALSDGAGTLTLPAASFGSGSPARASSTPAGSSSGPRSRHDHRRADPRRAGLLGRGRPLQGHATLDRERRDARRGGDAALPGGGTGNLKWIDHGPRSRRGGEGLSAAGEERLPTRRASPARRPGSSWSCPRRAGARDPGAGLHLLRPEAGAIVTEPRRRRSRCASRGDRGGGPRRRPGSRGVPRAAIGRCPCARPRLRRRGCPRSAGRAIGCRRARAAAARGASGRGRLRAAVAARQGRRPPAQRPRAPLHDLERAGGTA